MIARQSPAIADFFGQFGEIIHQNAEIDFQIM